jgi:cysteinyl-tRNA synthetase
VGNPDFDRLPGDDEIKGFRERLKLAETAVDNNLTVLVMDYAKTPKMIDLSYQRNKKSGLVSSAVHQLASDLNGPPPYPKRPRDENSESILSLAKVRNFLYLRNTEIFGREDEYVLKLHENNYDLIIVDVFHKSRPLSKQAVETLKYKKLGTRRMVLAYMDIGTVANHMYYWRPEWWDRPPHWVAEEHPDGPDKYYAEFWRPEWQDIITGSPQAFIQGIQNLGFDGVVLGGMESVNYFVGATDGW